MQKENLKQIQFKDLKIGDEFECYGDVYNVMFTNEDTLHIVKILYYDNCLSIDREKEKSNEILKWTRPINSKKSKPHYNWTEKDKLFLINNSVKDCLLKFNGKTEASVKSMRILSIKKNKNDSNNRMVQ